MSPLPAISALVVTYRTGPRLHEALYALKGDPDISEIVIVDNGNPTAEQDWIDRFVAACPKALLLREGDNPGFGTAMNRAAAKATGALLLACNPDCVIKRGAMRPMSDALESAPRPAIVGGRIFGLDGQEERGARRNTLTLWNAIGLGRWALDGTPEPAGPVRLGAVTGAFFLIRAEDYRALGGFDEAYFLHVEDVDLCRRAIEAGGSVTYQPQAGALHYTSTSDAPRDKVQAHKVESLKRYFRKFAKTPGEKFATALMVPLIGLAMRLRG
jgi:GT2 family glycosyltransferase